MTERKKEKGERRETHREKERDGGRDRERRFRATEGLVRCHC